MKEKLAKFLFKYRITPHTSTGIAPAELLMGRCLRSRLDLLKSDLSTNVENNQFKQKLAHDNNKPYRTFNEGETVYVEDFTTDKQKWIPGIIQRATGPLSYSVVLLNGSTVRRHVDSIKGRQRTSPNTNITPEDDNTFQLIPEVTSPVQIEVPTPNAASSEIVTSTRPVRNQRPPTRLDDFISTEEVSKL